MNVYESLHLLSKVSLGALVGYFHLLPSGQWLKAGKLIDHVVAFVLMSMVFGLCRFRRKGNSYRRNIPNDLDFENI